MPLTFIEWNNLKSFFGYILYISILLDSLFAKAKYPYINRNGNNYFRTFPIGGLISFLSDTTNWYDPHFYDGEFHNSENELKLFTSKREIYKDSKSLYDTYNQ